MAWSDVCPSNRSLHLLQPGVAPLVPHPLSQGHEKRLSRFDFASWPYLLLLVQHRDQSPLMLRNRIRVTLRLVALCALALPWRIFPCATSFADDSRERRDVLMPQIVASSSVLSAVVS